MAMNPFIGWGITTLMSYFLNHNSGDTHVDPAELSAETAELGTPVPVVMGRQMIKSPLTVYYGDFSSKAYTECYSAWAKFDAWKLILSALAIWAATAITGHDASPHTHNVSASGTGSNSAGPVHVTSTGTAGTHTPNPIPTKEELGPKILDTFVKWLLVTLINGRLLKTTIQKGFKYYLGYQMMVCLSGENIRLRGVYIGYEKNSKNNNSGPVWTGDESRELYQTEPFVVHVDDEDLFGGDDEGGGFIGDVRVYLGGAEQPADPWMIQQMSAGTISEELRGLTPAYRPFVSIVVPTGYIGKQASVPNMYLDMQWIPNRLGLGGIGDNDANPAECIYEMIVNKEWGLGRDPESLNVDSLLACGKALAKEGLGISIKITSKTEVKTIIDNICDHLDMVRYDEPTTGKLTFKLIRDDYDLNSLPVIDESVASEINYTRTVWSTAAGEVVAKYSDSSSLYDTSTVTENDPAVIEANNGDRNSQDVDFTYFTTSANATWAANREQRQRGYPLASVRLVCNRKAYSYRQGDVFKLNWKPYGISGLVMRVSDIDLGDFVTGEITIEAVEDVFGVGKTTYGANDSTSWTPPKTYPTGVQLFRYFEAPWEIQQSKESYVYAAAVLPDSLTAKWSIWRYKDSSWIKTNSLTKWTPAGQLAGSVAEDGDVEDAVGFEVINLGGLIDLAGRNTESGIALARNGSRILMVDTEIMAWGTISQLANGNFKMSNVLRGIFDTVPATHAPGATVYFLDYGYYGNVTTGGPVCAAGITASEKYNITTATAYAEEEFSSIKITALTTTRRAERPNPPGRIRLTSHLASAVPRLTKAAGDLALSWAVRNKNASNGCVSQDDITDYYSGQEIAAPNDIKTVIRAYLGAAKIHEEVVAQTEDADGTNLVTPTSSVYSWAQRCKDSLDFSQDTIITIGSKLNDLESSQSQSRTFAWKPPYIVDACATEEEALQLIAAMYKDGQVTVSFPDASMNKTIEVADMPLIILGTSYDTATEGAVLTQAGKWIVPDGTALAITGKDSYDTVTLASGYIAFTYLHSTSLGDLTAYQFDGAKFNVISMPKH